MIIDIHAHAYRIKCPFVTPFCTLEELLKEQERLGIDMSCVLPVVSPEMYIPQNTEDIIEMANKYPNRIIPFMNVDPRALTNSPFAKLEELLEFYKAKGCVAVGEVMPNMELKDPKVQNLFRACEVANVPVTYDGSYDTTGDFGIYDDPGLPQLEMTLQRYPNLIILGHGPVFWSEIAKLETPGERAVMMDFYGNQMIMVNTTKIKEEGVMPKLLRRYKNLHCDLSDCTAYNALTRDLDYTKKFIEEFQDRMYFGTDLCFPGMEVPLIDTMKKWKETGFITEEAYDKIMYKNAVRLLKLKI